MSAMSPGSDPLLVVAGAIEDARGRVLIAQRLPGTHMAGRWELPGGKLRPGEGHLQGLRRELREELGIELQQARPLIRIAHDYPDRSVVLHAYRVLAYQGTPVGREGQALRWLPPDELAAADLLEADAPIVTALRLPDRYLITGAPSHDPAQFARRLSQALARGVTLVQLRAPDLPPEDFRRLAENAAARCRAAGVRLLINGEPAAAAAIAREVGADGVHVPARYLASLAELDLAELLTGASCHDAAELRLARDGGAHFAVLGPVRATPCHPDAAPLGWSGFRDLVARAGLPVYALGGVGEPDMACAWDCGAQGIAAIRALWPLTPYPAVKG